MRIIFLIDGNPQFPDKVTHCRHGFVLGFHKLDYSATHNHSISYLSYLPDLLRVRYAKTNTKWLVGDISYLGHKCL